MNDNPEDYEEINVITFVRNEYNKIEEEHPDVIERIEKLPNRVKTLKSLKNRM